MSNKDQSIYNKIFWSKSSLIAFLIAIIYASAQFFSNSNNNWDANKIVFLITVTLLTYFLTTSILTIIVVLDELLNKKNGKIKKDLSEIIDKRFVETISSFTKAHKGFINGIYENYPHNFTTIFDEHSDNYEKLKKGKRSLYIWMNSVSVPDYADFAMSLLKLTTHSVYSTTYFDNADFIDALKDNKVISWIDEVNKQRNENNEFKIIRVHMFKNNSSKNGKTITTGKDMNEFIDLIKQEENEVALTNYKEKYINANNSISDDYKVWQDFSDIKFYGEYLIFDKQIMIKYDEDFKTLELYIGKIVEEYSKSFELGDGHFVTKNEMLQKL